MLRACFARIGGREVVRCDPLAICAGSYYDMFFDSSAVCNQRRGYSFEFQVIHQSSKSNARVGRIVTSHGHVDTPGYVAVATNGALKCVEFSKADEEGLQLAFCNTYHLMLHPGVDAVERAGGLHTFIGRTDRPLITDSGGFQIFSLAYGGVHEEIHSLKRQGKSKLRSGNKVVSVGDDGVVFKSYRDGTQMLLSPESSVRAQKILGADIILPLDELPPYHVRSREELAASVERSHQWERQSLEEHLRDPRGQAMYGIVHGGMDKDLRSESVRFVAGFSDFRGFAIGGSLGKNREELVHIMTHVMQDISTYSSHDNHRPSHVLGIADPISIPRLVGLGCDTFDSCWPTRVARHGCMITADGPLKVRSAKFKNAHRPPVEDCCCSTCKRYTLSYLHHLVKASEPLACSLLSLHNISYMCAMMARIRNSILMDQI